MAYQEYRVKYYYSDSGMEGRADEKDYGVWCAETPEEAIDMAIKNEYPEDKVDYPGGYRRSLWDWMRGCMTATEVPNNQGNGLATTELGKDDEA